MFKKILMVSSLLLVAQTNMNATDAVLKKDIATYVQGKTEQEKHALFYSCIFRITDLLQKNRLGQLASYSWSKEIYSIASLEELLYTEKILRDYLLAFAHTHGDNLLRMYSNALKGALVGSALGLVLTHFFWVKDFKKSKAKAAAKYLYGAVSAASITALVTYLISAVVLKQKTLLFSAHHE